MNRRSHGSKTTIAFWMLVAIADGAMLVTAVGPAVTVSVLAGIALVVSAVVVSRRSNRPRVRDQIRALTQPRPIPQERPASLATRLGVTATEAVSRRRA
jgi:hypothetical protein